MDMLGEGDWFCEMNTYDVRRNFCGAKEQSAEEVRKEREQGANAMNCNPFAICYINF